MNNMAIPFDTLAFVKKLIQVGVEPQVAEVQAELQATVLKDFANQRLATRDDMFHLNARIDKLESKVDKRYSDLLIHLGGVMVACTAVLGAMMTILSHLH